MIMHLGPPGKSGNVNLLDKPLAGLIGFGGAAVSLIFGLIYAEQFLATFVIGSGLSFIVAGLIEGK